LRLVTFRDGDDTRMFELEIAAVVGADQEIAAFTLLNDWSARDLQAKEMTVGTARTWAELGLT
jgi:2-keto-4-pentenoate hydratase/2-oxohepta-3-ene-1,7-dioic acid hydratase in catechol pathway